MLSLYERNRQNLINENNFINKILHIIMKNMWSKYRNIYYCCTRMGLIEMSVFMRIQLINLKAKIILFCMKIYAYIELRIKKFF